jgi:hypothetical protein
MEVRADVGDAESDEMRFKRFCQVWGPVSCPQGYFLVGAGVAAERLRHSWRWRKLGVALTQVKEMMLRVVEAPESFHFILIVLFSLNLGISTIRITIHF